MCLLKLLRASVSTNAEHGGKKHQNKTTQDIAAQPERHQRPSSSARSRQRFGRIAELGMAPATFNHRQRNRSRQCHLSVVLPVIQSILGIKFKLDCSVPFNFAIDKKKKKVFTDVRRKKSQPPMHLNSPLPRLAQGIVGISHQLQPWWPSQVNCPRCYSVTALPFMPARSLQYWTCFTNQQMFTQVCAAGVRERRQICIFSGWICACYLCV